MGSGPFGARTFWGQDHLSVPSVLPPPLLCRYVPFSGGPRKCVGDQFALMEAVVALAVILKRFDFSLVPGQQINMTTGATIHTTDGLYMNMRERSSSSGSSSQQQGAAAAVVA